MSNIPYEIAAHASPPDRSSAWMDGLQMLSGVALILFMGAHLLLVSSVILSPRLMDAIAWSLETTYLAQLGGPAIAALLLLHFLLAARKIPFRLDQQRIFLEHAKRMRHRDTWLWGVQVATAFIILIMGFIHIWTVLTDLPITAAKSAKQLAHWRELLFYLVLLPSVWLHLAIGFYRICVKWGVARRDNRSKFVKIEIAMAGGAIGLGLLSMFKFLMLAA